MQHQASRARWAKRARAAAAVFTLAAVFEGLLIWGGCTLVTLDYTQATYLACSAGVARLWPGPVWWRWIEGDPTLPRRPFPHEPGSA
jgi:predicted lipoprotein with Yx(FWY)xxD motif